MMVDRLKEIIRRADRNAARTQQVDAGPSEIGDPCELKLSYKSTGMQRVNHYKDSWEANVGTLIHAYLEELYNKEDAGSGRWLTETRVTAVFNGVEISGTCDLYDCKLDEVVDFKTGSEASLKMKRRKGSPEGYRRQLHVYGLGWELLGRTPKRVGNIYLPRSGRLEEIFGWSEPYDRRIAQETLQRYGHVRDHARQLLARDGDRRSFAQIPRDPSTLCGWCDYHMPKSQNPDQGCPGKGVAR